MQTARALACALLMFAACGDDSDFRPPPDAPIFPPNTAPKLTVTQDKQLSLVGRTITLNAAALDAEGDPVTIAWTQTAGPTVALTNPTSAEASFVVRAVGEYRFTVVASDGLLTDERTLAATVYDLDGGEDFTLALKPDGSLFAWGENLSGQLGDPSVVSERRFLGPVCDTDQTDCVTHPFTGAVAVTTGRGHSIALKADGSVWAWGDDSTGQVGVNGVGTPVTTPHPVCNVGATDCTADPLTGVIHIAAGFQFSVALKADGTVVAWGQNSNGQLGNGDIVNSPVAVRVCAPGQTFPCTTFLDEVAQLAAGGGGHSLAIRNDGSLFAWGHNKSGQTGNGDSSQRNVTIPIQVCAEGATAPCATFLSGVIAVDAWSGHSLALRSDHSLWGWGSNDESELGAVTSITCASGSLCTETPVPVCLSGDSPCTTPFTNVASFAAGRRFSVALRTDGTVWSWGDNVESEQGNGTTTTRNVPGQVCAAGQTSPCTQFLDDVGVVAAGSFHALALRNNGLLYAWGDDEFGQLGNADAVDASIPVVVGGF